MYIPAMIRGIKRLSLASLGWREYSAPARLDTFPAIAASPGVQKYNMPLPHPARFADNPVWAGFDTPPAGPAFLRINPNRLLPGRLDIFFHIKIIFIRIHNLSSDYYSFLIDGGVSRRQKYFISGMYSANSIKIAGRRREQGV
jgi:hypothetical protein